MNHHIVSSARPRRSARGGAAFAAALFTLAAALLLAAPAARAATTVPGDAWVRAAHLVPGLGAMDVTARPAQGATVDLATAAGYGDVAPYQRLAPGAYTVELRPTGAPAGSAAALSSTFTAVAGEAYTLAGLGSLDAPRLATLQDDLTPPAAGQVRVRVLPAAAAAAQVTVTARNGGVIADAAVFGQPTAYAAVPAGHWVLDTVAAGVPVSTADVDLAAGGVYTVVVVDAPGGLGVRTVTDAAGAAAMPVGGAQTGGGGVAGSPATSSAVLTTTSGAVLAPVLLALAVLTPFLRRRVRAQR